MMFVVPRNLELLTEVLFLFPLLGQYFFFERLLGQYQKLYIDRKHLPSFFSSLILLHQLSLISTYTILVILINQIKKQLVGFCMWTLSFFVFTFTISNVFHVAYTFIKGVSPTRNTHFCDSFLFCMYQKEKRLID